MLSRAIIILISALFLGAAPVVAQTAGSDTTQPGASGDASDTAANDTAEEAAPADNPQDNLTIEAFGDWEVRCDAASGNCFMYQLARDADLNPVSEMTIVPLPEGGEAALGVTVITPLGTMLNEGVVMQIDSGTARQYPFNWCTRSGCYARFGLTPGEVNSMKAGATARLRLLSVSAPDQPVILQLSLRGFTAAHSRLLGL